MPKTTSLPSGWKYLNAREVFESVTDKSHNGERQVLSATQDRGIVPRSTMGIDISYDKKSLPTYKRVVPGNFVIHLRSFQGGLAYSDIEGVISPAYVILNPKETICDGYYKYLFRSVDYIKRLNVAVYGIRDGKQISYDSFGMIKIPVPPLPEQQRIAEILATQDGVIALKQRLIDAKNQQKRWLMQNLLTGKMRLPGFGGAWARVKLGNHLVEHTATSNNIDKYLLYSSSRKGLLPQSEYYLQKDAAQTNNGYKLVLPDQITYRHMSDDEIFHFNINSTGRTLLVSWEYPVFTTKDINMRYLVAYLNSPNKFRAFCKQQKKGGTRTRLYFNVLKQFAFFCPPLPEQTAIAERLTTADREINLLTRELEQQKLVKKYLMQQLLTGKKRVKEASAV